jgi:hypothetical protein
VAILWANRNGKTANGNCDSSGVPTTATTPDKGTHVATAILDNRRQEKSLTQTPISDNI